MVRHPVFRQALLAPGRRLKRRTLLLRLFAAPDNAQLELSAIVAQRPGAACPIGHTAARF